MRKFLNKRIRISGQNRGFTVIEAFVGITVLLIGVVGPMVLVNRNFQAARFSRDQITAYYLAQEALEVIRQVRDDNILASSPWNQWLTVCQNGCIINGGVVNATQPSEKIWAYPNDCLDNRPSNCSLGSRRLLIENSVYGHGGGEATKFYRWVKLDTVDGDSNRYRARVFVDFEVGNYMQSYETSTIITNWTP